MSNYVAENDRKYKIWGRDCMVKLIFDCYEGEEIDCIQEEAIADFEKNIMAYTQNGLDALKKYLVQNHKKEIEDESLPNIFKYVVPKTVYVSKDPSKKKVIGLLCHFKFDDEDGIAIKYVDGKVCDIGGEQIVL